MFRKHTADSKQLGKILNDWVYKSVKQIVLDEQELARSGLSKSDDVFYELNSAFLFIVIDIITRSGFNGKQNIMDAMHKQNIEWLITDNYIKSNETIDYRRCLSHTYKKNAKIMEKNTDWMEELAKAILGRTEGHYEDETAVSMLTNQIASFYESTVEMLKKCELKN